MSRLLHYKKEIVQFFLANEMLISPEFIEALNGLNDIEGIKKLIKENVSADQFDLLIDKIPSIGLEIPENHRVKIISSYDRIQTKKEVKDFVSYFLKRYQLIERILSRRQELPGLLPIVRILQKKDKENISMIGMVSEKQETKNGNIMLTLEDPTGLIKVIINKSKPELFELAKDIVYDEIIGINGFNDKEVIFANAIIWPDVPNNKEFKKSPDEAYAVFLSDIHVGSKNFLEKDFQKFVLWTNQKLGNSTQRKIASKIKYIFIAGDLVDGVGIYPGQNEDLSIQDIYDQYSQCAKYLKGIPSHIPIIVGPGNHDAMRISEPQPVLYKDYAKALWELPNIYMVSNPAIVNIHASPEFPGFDVLLYHGYSFDYYVQEVDSIRTGGGYDRADLIMKFLLQRRHLAPSHKSTLYIANPDEDPLVITTIPDFFATGHIHKCAVALYRNVTMICGSCWQSKTAFQEKVGHNPEPSKVPIVNLQTREVKIMKFGD